MRVAVVKPDLACHECELNCVTGCGHDLPMRGGVVLTVLFVVAAMPAAAQQACPQARDLADEQAALYTALGKAGNELAARGFHTALWRLWTEAPDARAQEILDTGMAARESYDFDRAHAAFEALVAYCPAYAEGYNQRAFVAFLREDHAAALTDLERALELNPDHVAALAGLGLTLMRLGRTEASQAALCRALRLNPWLPERAYVIDPPQPGGTDL